MKVLIIDNFDSFTYNLYQVIGEILSSRADAGLIGSFNIQVIRNNEMTLEEISAEAPDRIIISPGPGSPDDVNYFGVCASVILNLGKTIPLLGVCLGMQGITHVFGGRVIKAQRPMHGKTSVITHNGSGLFKNLPNHIEIMRYHSLVAEYHSLPRCLNITAIVGQHNESLFGEAFKGENNVEIMAVQHKDYPIYGVQYHPESFASEAGKDIISNFLFNGSNTPS